MSRKLVIKWVDAEESSDDDFIENDSFLISYVFDLITNILTISCGDNSGSIDLTDHFDVSESDETIDWYNTEFSPFFDSFLSEGIRENMQPLALDCVMSTLLSAITTGDKLNELNNLSVMVSPDGTTFLTSTAETIGFPYGGSSAELFDLRDYL